MAVDFSRLTVIELRQELKRRNLPQNGKKADLIDRLATFESDRTSPEPTEDDHEASGSPSEKGVAEDQYSGHSDPPREEESAEAPHPSTTEAAAEAPIANQDTDNTPAAVIEPAESAEASVQTEALAPEDADEVARTKPVPVTEIITDAVSRKRRSRSPPPEIESSRKRARPSDDQSGEGDIPQHSSDLPAQSTREDSPAARPVFTLQTATGTHAATRETSPSDKGKHYEPAEERNWRQDRAPSPQHYQEQLGNAADEPIEEFERDVAPAQHPATSALYIKNFMRPLREPMLQDYLIDLAALPGSAPDPSCLVDFHLDQIRTHALVSFNSISAASRVRTALHGTVWPNERNRKELWADFIPEDKVVEWIDRERSEGGRSSNRWEVRYELNEEGTITANLVNAEMEPIRRNSTRQPLGPPPVPTGPARSYPGVEGAPLGPRGRGTNHYRQAQMPASAATTAGDRDRGRDYNDDNDRSVDYKTTRAFPSIQYKPVPEDVAERRLDNMNAHITKDRRRDLGRPEEINRYTFEDGDLFVDRGKEAFVGIRPPHRERERRRMGIGRGGNRGGPPPRRRTPSPRRPARDDGGYRGGGRRNDYDRGYRDRNDDRHDRRDDRDRDFGGRDRYRDEVPRSRFDGQPLPTFGGGGGGGRGGRWGGGGGGGGRRDRF